MEKIDNEYYVSLEVAKLLKEAGFDWLTHQYYGSTAYLKRTHTAVDPDEHKASAIYWKEDTALTFSGHRNDDSLSYSAPTLDVTQRWLREVKGIEVYAHVFYDSREMLDEWDVYVYEVNHIIKQIEDWINSYDVYHSYEEAQEAGIKEALEMILEKGE